MTIYIALLRGINVGGKNMIKMAELKRVLEALGLIDVQTYIQSGNLLFRSEEDEKSLSEKLQDEIKTAFGVSIPVILRTAAEFEGIMNNCPYSEAEVAEAEALAGKECLHVALLLQNPLQEKLEKLTPYCNEIDDYQVIGREVYLLLRNGVYNSKLANSLTKLDVPETMRNWKTIKKLVELAQAMES